ncbi:MAG TPA: serpin family protein [Actinomycetota bacterium]|nr:serpin family protein [Actinomycetota bacterium]
MRRFVVALASLLLLVSCTTARPPAPTTTGEPLGPSLEGTEGELLTVDIARAEPDGADLDALVDGMTRFGVEVFDRVAEPGANVVLSPTSISMVFGMARAGAAGTTAEEIDSVLHFPANAETTHVSFNALDRLLAEAAPDELRSPDPEATGEPGEESPPALEIANGVFPQVGFPILERYLETLGAQYGAGVIPVDFGTPGATQVIDDWVTERTRGRIDRLFDSLPPETKLVLANAVYLKADWAVPFAKDPTEDLPFTLADGAEVVVPTMQQLGRVRYAEGDGWQAVELPYVGGRLAMWVLVPMGDRDPGDVLTPDVLASVGDGLADGTVELHLPRWDFATNMPLRPVLQALGMQAPFDVGAADFSGISQTPLWIGDAIHRATITVDEWGTEAAAVTGLAFATSGPPAPDAVIRADHPFAFVILDTRARVPLFLGQVADPSA